MRQPGGHPRGRIQSGGGRGILSGDAHGCRLLWAPHLRRSSQVKGAALLDEGRGAALLELLELLCERGPAQQKAGGQAAPEACFIEPLPVLGPASTSRPPSLVELRAYIHA